MRGAVNTRSGLDCGGPVLDVRPGQALCMICRLGAGQLNRPVYEPLRRLFERVRRAPRSTVRICTLQDIDPPAFSGDGTWGSEAFNILRDLRLLRAMRLVSGQTVSLAHFLHGALLPAAKKAAGYCAFDSETGPEWKSCPLARLGHYERGHAALFRVLQEAVPGAFRSPNERARVKARSVQAIGRAARLPVLVHHLGCMTCGYGFGLEDTTLHPVPHNNLIELADAMRRNPEVRVTLVAAGCMACRPCLNYDPLTGRCGIHAVQPSSGVPASQADFALLQRMGLKLGDSLPARVMIRRLYDAVKTTIGLCGDDRCNRPFFYDRGRKAGLGFLEAAENPGRVVRRVTELLSMQRVARLLPVEERAFLRDTVTRAGAALKAGRRRDACKALVDRPFWNAWKLYLEKAAVSEARLPASISRDADTVATGQREIVARRAGLDPIVCDGRLRERGWKPGAFTAGFQTTGGRPAVAEVGFKVRYDRCALYVGILCAARDTGGLKADAAPEGPALMTKLTPDYDAPRTAGLGAYVWDEADDSLSVFLQPDRRRPRYVHFMLNPRGVKTGQVFEGSGGGRRRIGAVPDAAWDAGVRLSRQLWSAELRLPFAVLGAAPSARWRINVHRVFGQELDAPRIVHRRGGFDHVHVRERVTPPRDALRAPESWSYVPGHLYWHELFHDVEAMGRLTFA